MLAALLSLEPTRAIEEAQTVELARQDRLRILAQAADTIEARYLDKARGSGIAAGLRSHKARSRLQISSPQTFAREATSLLFELSGDRHLSLKWSPDSLAPDNHLPTGTDHGIRAVRFLAGNIGVLRLDSFHDNLTAREAMTAALLILRNADALVLDFRANGGGASDAVRLLQSCFFAEPTLVMYYEDTPGERKPSMTEEPPKGVDCRAKPLYILMSSRTASAAEDFIYAADISDLGTTIGEATAGAAHFVAHTDIEPGFRLAVSVGRPVHPGTETNWEGVGIAPDIEITPDMALDRAHFEALQVLHDAASGRERNHLLYHLHRIRARLHPSHLNNGDLKIHVGRYGSTRVTLTTDGLLFEDPGGLTSPLEPLDKNVFQMNGRDAGQVIFETRDDRSRYLELLYPSGIKERHF